MKPDKIMNFLENVAFNNPLVANQRVSAALVLKGNIISVGTNQRKTHPFQNRYKKHPEALLFHAETSAIHNSLKQRLYTAEDVSKCTLYVCRTLKNRRWGLAKPCEGCLQAIVEYDIKKVYFTNDNGFLERL